MAHQDEGDEKPYGLLLDASKQDLVIKNKTGVCDACKLKTLSS